MRPTPLLYLGLLLSPLFYTGPALASGNHTPQTEATVVSDTLQQVPENWYHLDAREHNMKGVSTDKAYEYLKNRPSKTVVVAVIDSGIDILHEDLKDKIWTNPKEVAGNGLDDDRNGYVDDIHGWNFIGGANGENVDFDTMELTRLYAKLKPRFENTPADKVRRRDRDDYALYQKVKAEFEKELSETKAQYAQFKPMYEMFQKAHQMVGEHLGKENFTATEVAAMQTEDPALGQAQALLLHMEQSGLTAAMFTEYDQYFRGKLEYQLNPEFDPRPIVGDDYNNLKERVYGNNDVMGPYSKHGTHVAGIIGANRQNGLGIQGIADNVQIMSVRAVPNGDERDKDIANAIRYAVDNGAQIINMSFGKSYSPHQAVVDEAVKYASSKGVLLVHSAGNDGKDRDTTESYPNRQIKRNKEVANWLEVGASSWGEADKLVGSFSNYGHKTVDVFAPGVDIYSTVPKHGYEKQSGTSMAAPVTSGVAALIMSYFPDLTAEQVRDIVVQSTVRYADLEVNKPGEGPNAGKTTFGALSTTGGIVNAYEAVKLASSMSRK